MTHIAIDGPVASGKGTIARELSKRLGIPCLDTGALYRGLAVWSLGRSPEEITNVSIDTAGMTAKIVDGITRVYLSGKDITPRLRDNEISKGASTAATNPKMREICTKLAQDIAATQDLIMEGRDICNVVLPNAKYKFLLTADVKVRAGRRHADLIAAGKQMPFKEVLKQTKARDKSDRKKGGFKKITNAVIVDATKRSIDEVVVYMLSFIK